MDPVACLSNQFEASVAVSTPLDIVEKKGKGQFGGASRSVVVHKSGEELEDDYYTPPEATQALLRYLSSKGLLDQLIGEKVLEPCYGAGHIASVLAEAGLVVLGRDKFTLPESHDILTSPIPEGVRAIITNPPYGIKNDILKWAFCSRLPFALLLPFDVALTISTQKVLQNYPYHALILSPIIRFKRKDGTPVCIGSTAWFLGNWGFEDKLRQVCEIIWTRKPLCEDDSKEEGDDGNDDADESIDKEGAHEVFSFADIYVTEDSKTITNWYDDPRVIAMNTLHRNPEYEVIQMKHPFRAGFVAPSGFTYLFYYL